MNAHQHRVPRANGHACDMACLTAASDPDECICICAGSNHGKERLTADMIAWARDVQRARDPFAGMPISDDESF